MQKRAKPLTRLYFPDLPPGRARCETSAAQAHHLGRVLRLEPGDPLIVFDGSGQQIEAQIEGRGHTGLTLLLGERRVVERESNLAITLVQGISSGDRMDYTLQKAVELGVSTIQPVATERSVVQLKGERAERRVAHWQAIVVSACEQCGRNRLPAVAPIANFRDWLARPEGDAQTRLLLSPRGTQRLADLPRTASVALLAGPEGGLAPAEEELAMGAGFTPVRLGPRVLRTETAALAAVAAMQTLWGDY